LNIFFLYASNILCIAQQGKHRRRTIFRKTSNHMKKNKVPIKDVTSFTIQNATFGKILTQQSTDLVHRTTHDNYHPTLESKTFVS
jgi:hypothetical protein